MTTKKYNLGGSGGGFGDLSTVLDQLLQLQSGGGGVAAPPATEPTAPLSKSSTPTAGMAPTTPQVSMGKVNMQAPVPKGAPPLGGQGQLLGESAGGGVQTGGQFASAAESGPAPGGGGGALNTSLGTAYEGDPMGRYGAPNTPGVSTTQQETTDYGDYGGLIQAVTDIPLDYYNAFSMDEQEKAARAGRHLMEQQFDIRQNWKGIYEDFGLPIQTGTKMYAYQQLGKDSDQYQYATNMLKGMIEGSTAVYAGQKDWSQVWDELGKIPDDMVPDNFMESFQDHYENDDVNNTAWAITTGIIKNLAPNMGKGLPSMIALEILKLGNATIKAALDMRA